MQREGVFREMKLRRAYEKPSEKKVRVGAEALRRHRKLMRKRLTVPAYPRDVWNTVSTKKKNS